jgi:hypothetical protein
MADKWIIFEKKKIMSKLIYFKGICTLSIVWEAGPVVLSNCKNMMHKLEQDDIDTTLNTPYEPLSDKTLRPFWDCYSIQPKTKRMLLMKMK